MCGWVRITLPLLTDTAHGTWRPVQLLRVVERFFPSTFKSNKAILRILYYTNSNTAIATVTAVVMISLRSAGAVCALQPTPAL